MTSQARKIAACSGTHRSATGPASLEGLALLLALADLGLDRRLLDTDHGSSDAALGAL